jgi:translocation and assembly module TamB
MRRLGKILLRTLAGLAVFLAVASLAGLVVVQSGWFHEYVRKRIITVLDNATGGHAELGRFSFRGPTLTARVSQLVLHGKESATEPPLLRVASVTLRLRILSFLEPKIDLASIDIEQPLVRIAVYPDGSTNLPSPRPHPRGKSWAEQMLNLAIGRYRIDGGLMEYDNRKIPLNLRGKDLAIRMTYDARTPEYLGEVSSKHLRVLPGGLAPIELGMTSRFSLQKTQVVFSQLSFTAPGTRADLTGTLVDLREPHGAFHMKAAAAVRDVIKMFPVVPLEPTGTGEFDGEVTVGFGQPFVLGMVGRVNGRGIGYQHGRLKISDAGMRGDMNMGLDGLTLTGVQGTALGARFTGRAALVHWRQFHFDGNLAGLSVTQAGQIFTDRRLPWNGVVAGNFSVDAVLGRLVTTARGSLDISPASEGPPLEGHLETAYDQTADEVSLGSSWLATGSTRLDLSGTLGRMLQVQLRSMDLDDVAPALALVETNPPRQIPLRLNRGMATASGTVTGPLDQPHFNGQVSVTNGSVNGHGFDKFTGELDASRDAIVAHNFTLSRGATEATGNAGLSARNGVFTDASIQGEIGLRNARLDELAKEAGATVAVAGTASATLRLSGTLGQPRAGIALDVQKPAAFGQRLDHLRANLNVSQQELDVTDGTAQDGAGTLSFSGVYRPSQKDWKTGDVQVKASAQNIAASSIAALSALRPPVDARLDANVRAGGRLGKAGFAPSLVSGTLSAQSVTIDRRPIGSIALTAETAGSAVAVHATGKLGDTSVEGQGSWPVQGDRAGSATLRFGRLSASEIHHLVMLGGTAAEEESELPFEGFVDGAHASVSFPLRRPQDLQAELTIDTVQVNPRPTQALRLGVKEQDLVLKSSQPVMLSISSKAARIRSARFTGRDTSIDATGEIPFGHNGSADISLRGSVSLTALQLLNPNLLARGNATVQASLRGALRNPTVNGRMELKNASLYLNDLPNGVDNANGVILFDRNRATIQTLTAETGGGKISFSGFLEFGSVLLYRLQAKVDQVRVRYPEALSTTFTAQLALNGTSDSSTVSGTVTLNRAVFNPRTDIGQLLAASAAPVPTPVTPNEYLRGMQLDIRILNAPNFEFETSLTRNVEAEVDLRLRGTPVRPVLLGSISVNQGEVRVFGTRYTIDRGDIRFLNPVRIEPTLDIDLETQARAVTVNVTLSGTMQKLKVNYSSDPPLQTSEIIALLAVGREPSESAGLASAQTTSNAGFVEAGGGLLGEAVSAQLSSRLQRFFGSSRVKIDPTMTGVDNLPQARLTFEQQVSRDITLTYITNLNYTQEQIVRVQWDFSRDWSAVAVRDANGLFGIDFQFRKRFQ